MLIPGESASRAAEDVEDDGSVSASSLGKITQDSIESVESGDTRARASRGGVLGRQSVWMANTFRCFWELLLLWWDCQRSVRRWTSMDVGASEYGGVSGTIQPRELGHPSDLASAADNLGVQEAAMVMRRAGLMEKAGITLVSTEVLNDDGTITITHLPYTEEAAREDLEGKA